MIARFTTYPSTSKPEDVMKMVHDDQYRNFFFSDVQARGYYPSYMERYFAERNIEVIFEKEAKATLQNGAVDFIIFSYYMSLISSSDPEHLEQTSGNLVGGLKNPHLKASDWGWKIDEQMKESIKDGVDLLGYTTWSAIDEELAIVKKAVHIFSKPKN